MLRRDLNLCTALAGLILYGSNGGARLELSRPGGRGSECRVGQPLHRAAVRRRTDLYWSSAGLHLPGSVAAAEAAGLGLQSGIRVEAATDLSLRLLPDVRHLVGQQLLPGLAVGVVPSRLEVDVVPAGEGQRVQLLRDQVGLGVGVQAHAREVVVQPGLQRAPDLLRQRLPAPAAGLDPLHHRSLGLPVQLRCLPLKRVEVQGRPVLTVLLGSPLQRLVQRPLQVGALSGGDLGQHHPGNAAGQRLPLQGRQRRPVLGVALRGWAPVGPEALGQSLPGIPQGADVTLPLRAAHPAGRAGPGAVVHPLRLVQGQLGPVAGPSGGPGQGRDGALLLGPALKGLLDSAGRKGCLSLRELPLQALALGRQVAADLALQGERRQYRADLPALHRHRPQRLGQQVLPGLGQTLERADRRRLRGWNWRREWARISAGVTGAHLGPGLDPS